LGILENKYRQMERNFKTLSKSTEMEKTEFIRYKTECERL